MLHILHMSSESVEIEFYKEKVNKQVKLCSSIYTELLQN